MRALWLSIIVFFLLGTLLAKSEYYCHPPSTINVQPVYNGAQINWTVNLPDSMISYNSNSPGGIWQPGLGHGLGVIFDLSAFPGATLEQVDFLHYSIQRLRGPYKYRIHILDMDNATTVAIIDSLEAGDSYDIPRYEIGVELGSIPAPAHAGIFVEGLSDTTISDKQYSFPAMMSDTTDLVPSTSYYCTDMSDPFYASDPDYTNIYEVNVIDNSATNMDLDLWINYDQGNALLHATDKYRPTLPVKRLSNFAPTRYAPYHGPAIAAKPAAVAETGFTIFRGALNDTLINIGVVDSYTRQFVDTHPWPDSTYTYAVAAYCDEVSTERLVSEYHHPRLLTVAETRVDSNSDFIPDKLGQQVYFKAVISTPPFNGGTLFFVQDETGGTQIDLLQGPASIEEGDSIFITGTVSQSEGMTTVMVDSMADLQTFASGTVLDTTYINAAGIAEAYEGQLVAVNNITFSDPLNWPALGQSAIVTGYVGDTTVTIVIDADTDIDGWSGPQGAVTLVGVVEQATSHTPPNDGYRLRPRYKSDFLTYVGIRQDAGVRPTRFALLQNFPNPFNPKTVIGFQLPVSSRVELSIFNILGQKITTLVAGEQAAGSYRVEWDGSGFASGIYYYTLVTDHGFIGSKKLLLLK